MPFPMVYFLRSLWPMSIASGIFTTLEAPLPVKKWALFDVDSRRFEYLAGFACCRADRKMSTWPSANKVTCYISSWSGLAYDDRHEGLLPHETRTVKHPVDSFNTW